MSSLFVIRLTKLLRILYHGRCRSMPRKVTAMSTQRVLVIEDEVLISLMLQGMLKELGHEIAGAAFHADAALTLIESSSTRFDAATVDIVLDGEPCAGVVAALNQRGIPFIVVTGFLDRYLPECVRGRPVLSKPFTVDDLQKSLKVLSTMESVRDRPH